MVIISLRKHILQVIIMIAFMALCFISMGVVFTHKTEAADATAEFKDKYIADENGYKRFYTVQEFITDDELHEYMEDDGTLYKKLKKLVTILQKQKEYKYIPGGGNPLDIEGQYTDDIFLYGYEYGKLFEQDYEIIMNDYKSSGRYAVKAKTVPVSFFEEFSIELDEGDMFKDEDGIIKEEGKIPVVLGKAYRDYYNIGDTITAYFMASEKPYLFEVSGFLKSNSFFYSFEYQDFVSCERFIFMPNLQDDIVSPEIRRGLLDYLCGIIDTNISYEEITKRFNEIKNQCGLTTDNIFVNDMQLSNSEINSEILGDDVFTSEAPPILKQYALMTDTISDQYAVIAFIVLGFGVSTMTLLLCGIIKDSFYRFGVQMLCGASRVRINKQVTIMDSIPIFIADAIATITLLSLGADARSILILQVITVLVLAISVVISIMYLNRLNVQKIISKE